MPRIEGNQDGEGGRNESYKVWGRGDISRPQLVKEVEAGMHSNVHIVKVNGEKYVRDNPDHSKKDNVNQK